VEAVSGIPTLARPSDGPGAAAATRRLGPSLLLLVAIGGAWAAIVLVQLTGTAATLHHHALIEGGPPLWLAIPLFVLGWLVMVVAMMLPASLPTIRRVERAIPSAAWQGRAQAAFVAGFLGVWAAFGILAFLGDVVVHDVVDATPWLAARRWLVEVSVLILAGAYQLMPLKQRYLAACRHPGDLAPPSSLTAQDATRLGLHHGLACLACSWALMLVMSGEGFASLPWMAALTAVMAYESAGRHGRWAASVVGAVLLLVALTVLLVSLLGSA